VRIVFLGTAPFARPALEAVAAHHDVTLVVTQPDRPAGRKGDPKAPAVKEAARELGLPIVQPERVSRPEGVEEIQKARPEAIVVTAYGQLLKPSVFEIPPLGTINIHASLLPAYRGAAPVHWAIIRGERRTGITTFLIDAGMDTGPLLLKRAMSIGEDETAGDLTTRLANLGGSAILETLDGLASGEIAPSPQPEEGVSYAPPLTREDGRIDWRANASTVHDLVRGTSPWPGAWTRLGTERVKVHRSSRPGIRRGSVASGEIALTETKRLLVGCGDELIELVELQREGRPRTDGRAFLNGLRDDRCFELLPHAETPS